MKYLYAALLFLAFSLEISSQNKFQKTIVGAKDVTLFSVCGTQSGNIYVGGSYGFGITQHAGVTKLTECGDVIWSTTVGDVHEQNMDLVEGINGGVVAVGRTSSLALGGGAMDGLIYMLDSTGALLWNKILGGTQPDEFIKVVSLANNEYLAVGNTHSFGQGQADVLAVKFDSNGDTIWGRTYGGNLYEAANGVKLLSDNNIIIVGETKTYDQGNGDMYALKIDQNGDTLWTKSFGAGNGEKAYDVIELISGNLIVFGNDLNGLVLVKLDANGGLIWTKSYTGSGNVSNADEFSDMGLMGNDTIVLMSYESNKISGASSQDGGAMIIDTLGNVISANSFGTLGYNTFKSMSIIDNTPFFVGGQTPVSTGQGMLVKVDNLLNSGCSEMNYNVTSQPLTYLESFGGVIGYGVDTISIVMTVSHPTYSITTSCINCSPSTVEIEENKLDNNFTIYPNPSNTNFSIETIDNLGNIIKVFNSVGQEVYSIIINQTNTVIDVKDLGTKGLYILNLIDRNSKVISTKKLIVE